MTFCPGFERTQPMKAKVGSPLECLGTPGLEGLLG
jgi:hypothetical protein